MTSSPRSPFMLPELDRHIASHMDRASLACAARVSKLWYDIFSPVLWRHVSLRHLSEDDNYDDDFNFIPWTPSASSPPSLPSSCSSTWSSWSYSSSPPPKSPTSLSQGSSSPSPSSSRVTALHNSKLSLVQRAFVHASHNKVLKGLVRHGHHIIELTATGITDQEMAVIRQCCVNLRVIELIGGRYSAESLTELFTMRRDSIQTVRFRSCVLIKDIFQPLAHLSNLKEFELYGSFVGNTITSPYFFQQDLFPMLRACPLLRSVLIDQVYIIDQQVGQTFDITSNQATSGEGGGGDGGDDGGPLTGPGLVSSGSTSMLSVHLKAARSQPYVAIPSPSSSLRKFSLDCGDIPASVIMAFLATSPQLQELALDWSRELCDFSLSRLYTKCPHLTSISLSRCEQITDVGLKTLFKSYPNLTTVDLSHNELSDSVLEELARSCRWIQHLNLNHCRNVTDMGIQQLLLNMGSLTYLGLRFIPGLSCLVLDNVLTAGLAPIQSLPLLAYTPSDLSTYVPRPWACRDTLESLLLPDLVQPSRAMLEQYYHNLFLYERIDSSESVGTLESDTIVQKGMGQFTNLRTIIVGGNNIEMWAALSNLSCAHTLESLRITKLKRAMTIEDARWLIETAFPKLQQLNIPQFGNPQVTEWIRMRHPGLLSADK